VAGLRRPQAARLPAPNLVAQLRPPALRLSSLREMQLGEAIYVQTIHGQAIHGLTIWFAARDPRVRRHDVAARQFCEAALVWQAAPALKATALVPDQPAPRSILPRKRR